VCDDLWTKGRRREETWYKTKKMEQDEQEEHKERTRRRQKRSL
jgi:hypothetical protein